MIIYYINEDINQVEIIKKKNLYLNNNNNLNNDIILYNNEYYNNIIYNYYFENESSNKIIESNIINKKYDNIIDYINKITLEDINYSYNKKL